MPHASPQPAQDPRRIIDSSGFYGETVGEGFVRFQQEIPDDFLANIRNDRDASKAMRGEELHAVATVPVAVYDLWFRQGHDPYRWSAKELLQKLRADGLDAFIQTNKAL